MAGRRKGETLTDLQWAILATILVQPDYRFTGDERKAAIRLNRRGFLLKMHPAGQFFRLSSKGRRMLEERKEKTRTTPMPIPIGGWGG